MNCVGFLIFFHCTLQQPAIISDFCKQSEPEVVRLRVLSKEELSGLSRSRKEALLSLQLKFTKFCTKHG